MATTEVSVVLDYLHPWPNAAGFYVARERGLYAEVGLDVELRVHDYKWGDTLEYLSRRRADLGVFPPNRLLVRRERGEPLIAVAAVNHTGLETIQVARRSGVSRPAELSGRRVGYAPTPRGRAMVRGAIAADGGDPDSIITVDTGSAELTPEYLIKSDLDATFGGYWVWDVLSGQGPSDETSVWRVGELGLPKYHSYVLGAHEDFVHTSGDEVRRFLAATAQGFLLAAAEPIPTVALLEHIVPFVPQRRLARSLELVAPTWTHDGQWGELRAALFESYALWLASAGILQRPETWPDAITNDFLARPSSPVTSAFR